VTGHPVGERLLGTCLLGFAALQRGASVLRVHDVAEAVETVNVFLALERAAALPGGR
jgi:dihydropteroate synthase